VWLWCASCFFTAAMPRRTHHKKHHHASGAANGTSAGAGAGAGAGGKKAQATPERPIEEQVLRDIYALYKNPSALTAQCGSVGIEEMSRHVGTELLHPSKKITVMLIGNHSAGKSSFINWCDGGGVGVCGAGSFCPHRASPCVPQVHGAT